MMVCTEVLSYHYRYYSRICQASWTSKWIESNLGRQRDDEALLLNMVDSQPEQTLARTPNGLVVDLEMEKMGTRECIELRALVWDD